MSLPELTKILDVDRQQLIKVFGDGPLSTPTKYSIGSIDALVSECKRTRKRGFAIDDEEMSEGVRCVAAPIRDSTGAVISAIDIFGAQQSTLEEKVRRRRTRSQTNCPGH